MFEVCLSDLVYYGEAVSILRVKLLTWIPWWR